jgi:outer membrane protein TolC
LKQAEAGLAAAEADLLQAELNRSTAEAELRRTAGGR